MVLLPFVEQANSVAYDWSGEYDAASSGVTLGATGPGDDLTAYSCDGVNDKAGEITSGGLLTDLQAEMVSATGKLTFVGWAQVSGAGVWTDGAFRYVFNIVGAGGGENTIDIVKSNSSGKIWGRVQLAGTSFLINSSGHSETGYLHYAVVYDKEAETFKYYIDGVQQGATADLTGGAWDATSVAAVEFGHQSGGVVWSGLLARHRIIVGTALTDAQILSLVSITP